MGTKLQHDVSEWFDARKAARLSGLSLAMVNYLCRTGVAEPTCDCLRGHGSCRHYSFGDLVALRLLKRLSENGISVLRLKKAMQGLRKHHPEITLTSLPASHVVTNGKDLYLHQHGESLERVFDGQFAFGFVIELAPIQQEIARMLDEVEDSPPAPRPASRGGNHA